VKWIDWEDWIMTSTPVSTAASVERANETEMLKREKSFLREAHEARVFGDDCDCWKGLALSGGGIRSAIFSLGALQALAKYKVLAKIDYMSTVSGGGYIGSSLQWWWSAARRAVAGKLSKGVAAGSLNEPVFGVTEDDFPYGCEHLTGTSRQDSDQQKQNLSFLRNHGRYLAPGEGMTIWSGVYVVMRTVTLSIVICFPLLLLFFFLLTAANDRLTDVVSPSLISPLSFIVEDSWSERCANNKPSPKSARDTKIEAKFSDEELEEWRQIRKDAEKGETEKRKKDVTAQKIRCGFAISPLYAVFLWAYVAILAVFFAATLVFALLTRIPSEVDPPARRFTPSSVARLALGAILLIVPFSLYSQLVNLTTLPIISLSMLIGAALIAWACCDIFRRSAVNGSYWWRRTLEQRFGGYFLGGLFLLLIGLLPVLPYFFAERLSQLSGPKAVIAAMITAASGTGSALYGYFSFIKKIDEGIAGRIAAPVGAAIFIYGMLLIAYIGSIASYEAVSDISPQLIDPSSKFSVSVAFVIASCFALGLSFSANVNFLGLHRFYRDRLMEAFMPTPQAIRDGQSTYSPIADRLNLSDLKSSYSRSLRKSEAVPYPIINAFARIVRSKDPKIVSRGGDNFVLSPCYVGSRATGWEVTESYAKRYGPMTLATAMAASGAAVNSNAGYIGTGITRNRLVAAVMTVLNMRLGIWVGNPARPGKRRRVPVYISPTLTAGLLGFGYAETSAFIEISDGGNFENLGLYELVRRKLDVIIVVDGEADEKVALPALVSVAALLPKDFGATLSFFSKTNKSLGLERLVPVEKKGQYPLGASFASKPYVVGRIDYDDKARSYTTLIYIKATLVAGLDFTTEGYRAGNPDFPHQTTLDQFFDPIQFEAYRDLGYRSAVSMIKDLALDEDFSCKKKIVDLYESLKLDESLKLAESLKPA
jgi:hypothetical protein